MRPRVIIALGREAKNYFGGPKFMNDAVGIQEWYLLNDLGHVEDAFDLAVLYHPSANAKAAGLHDSVEQTRAMRELKPILDEILRGTA
jgi:uracil-DNA glycosylase